ncbi:hypothetical protein C1J05_09975 [Sulfitobacter sp. JL08]|uniref:type VI secretion system-associated protein TagO n=1 Tax=Sulfitobacter sp. JL08 TaxID=2070369 RepID=UPI000E0BFE16|nr:type VI secretion system-associated protein TagO [Sulfitobacter sp. JL08]AXI54781.1 hypothetical protein C1J05_09975 [Sulfitobacter sp. JL08]
MKLWLPLILIASPMTQTVAQEFNSCHDVADDTLRLDCYDAATNYEPPAEVEKNTDGIGNWKVIVDSSPMDDSKSVFVQLDSTNMPADRYGQSKNGWIGIRCKENTTSMFVSFADHFMSDHNGKGNVEYRLDDLSMSSVRMNESNDNSVLGLWSGSKSIPMIKKMIGRKKMVMRAMPFSDSTVTLEFDIVGLENAIVELRNACSW